MAAMRTREAGSRAPARVTWILVHRGPRPRTAPASPCRLCHSASVSSQTNNHNGRPRRLRGEKLVKQESITG